MSEIQVTQVEDLSLVSNELGLEAEGDEVFRSKIGRAHV